MATYVIKANAAAMIFKKSPNVNDHGAKVYSLNAADSNDGRRSLLLNLPDFPSSIQFNKINSVTLNVRFGTVHLIADTNLMLRRLPHFDPATITWADYETLDTKTAKNFIKIYESYSNTAVDIASVSLSDACEIIRGKAVEIAPGPYEYSSITYLATVQIFGGSNGVWPTLKVEYDDSYLVPLQVQYRYGPRDGEYRKRTQAISFAWTSVQNPGEYCVGSVSQESAVFHWRNGSSGSWTDISPANPLQQSITVPAGTFPISNEIQWYVSASSNSGRTSQSDVFSFRTADSTTYATPSEPINSYKNPRNPIAFSWNTNNSSGSLPTGADLQYLDGETWTTFGTLRDSNDTTFSAPANTFSIGAVQWRVRAYNADGVEGPWSSGVSFTTADYLTDALPTSPVNAIVDGSRTIVFSWTTQNRSGSLPTGADLQYEANSSWVDMGSIAESSASSYALPADTLPPGNLRWRVRAYNADGVAGSWSAAASFVNFTAPPKPTDVSCDPVPFTKVSWQAIGQQAWSVTVDGKEYGPYFGTEKNFEMPDYLEDGAHEVAVEVQGTYGLWSQAGIYSFTVENVPGSDVNLLAEFGRDALLDWETENESADFLIYRDGNRIGHTNQLHFSDRVVLGRHTWYIINRLPGGYYSKSNIVQGDLSTESIALALLSGGEWLELEKSRNPTRVENYTVSQTVEFIHFAGEEYPEAEVSPYKTMQGEFDVSWEFGEEERAKAFEEMIGKPVIYKAPSGEAMVGILSAYNKQPVNFFKAYSASIQRKNWRDYVDADR